MVAAVQAGYTDVLSAAGLADQASHGHLAVEVVPQDLSERLVGLTARGRRLMALGRRLMALGRRLMALERGLAAREQD